MTAHHSNAWLTARVRELEAAQAANEKEMKRADALIGELCDALESCLNQFCTTGDPELDEPIDASRSLLLRVRRTPKAAP